MLTRLLDFKILRAVAAALVCTLVAAGLTVTTSVSNSTAASAAEAPASMRFDMPSTVSLATSLAEIANGQSATLTATTDVNFVGNSLKIIDQTTGTTLKTCTSGTTCTVSASFTTGPSHEYVATVAALTSNTVTVSRAAWSVVLTTDVSEFPIGGSVTFTATANQNANSTYKIYIFDKTTGALLSTYATGCTSGTTCVKTTSSLFTSGDPHKYVAVVGATATSPTLLTVQDVQATSAEITLTRKPWVVTLTTNKTTFSAGDSITLTATPNQSASSTYKVYIFDTTTGALKKTCSSGTSCAITSTSLFTTGAAHDFIAVAAASGATAYSSLIDIQALSNPVTLDREVWTITLSSSHSVFAAGEAVSLTATTNQDVSKTGGAYRTYLFDTTTGALLTTCSVSTTCVNGGAGSVKTGAPHSYVAIVGAAGTPTSIGSVLDVQATSNVVTLSRLAWTVSLDVLNPEFAVNSAPVITASANQDPSKTGGAYRIYLFDDEGAPPIGICGQGPTCSAGGGFTTGGPHDYVAVVGATGTPQSLAEVQDVQATSNVVTAKRMDWEISLTLSPSYFSVELQVSANQYTNSAYNMYIVDLTDRRIIFTYNGTNFTFKPTCTKHTYIAYVAARGQTTASLADVQAYSQTRFNSINCTTDDSGGGNGAENFCVCPQGDPVSPATGEFYLPATDIALNGVGPLLGLSRTYTTTDAASDGPFGFGWSASFSPHLSITIPGDTSDPLPRQVEIVQENGSSVVFAQGVGDEYLASDKVHAALTHSMLGWTFTRNASEIMSFDPDGQLQSVSDRNGNAITLSYDTGGRVIALAASGGRSIELVWAGNHVVSASDSAGREVAYDYVSGNLTSVTAMDGSVTSYVYDAGHYMTSLTKPGGRVTSNIYDTSHRVTKQIDPLGRILLFAYSGSTTTITAADGSQIVDVYQNGRLSTQTRAANTALASTTTYFYDNANNVVQTIDPLGNSMNFNYDAAGNMTARFDPLGRTALWTYNEWNLPLTSTDPLGKVTTMTYDSAGNLLTATSPSGRTQTWTYNPDGTVDTSVDPAGKVTAFAYDLAGRLATTTDPLGLVTSLTYNAAGQGVSVTAPDGGTSFTTSDAIGRVLSATDPLGHLTVFGYDTAGRLISTTDALGNIVYASFDAADQQTSSTDASGAVTQYTYTPKGQLATVLDAQNNLTTLAYNSRGDLVSSRDALGRMSSRLYDLAGRVISSTRPSGATATVAYDVAGQVVSSTDAGGFTTLYTYDANGRITTVTDPLGRLTTASYGLDGELNSVTLPDLSTQLYEYDTAGRNSTFTNADGLVTSYAYGDSGQLLSKTEPGAMVTSYSYLDGRVASTTLPDGSVATYDYDLSGNTTSVDYSATAGIDATYTYDQLNRSTALLDVTGTSSFTYDSRGNLLSEVDGGGDSVGYSYDSIGLLESVTYPGADTVTYEYDAAGQLTSVTDWLDNESTFAWTADGQLATQTSGNGVAQARAYDSRGQLITSDVVGLTASLATFTYAYDAGGQLVASGATLNGVVSSDDLSYDPLSQLETATKTTNGTTTSAAYDASSAGQLTEVVGGRQLTYNAAQQLVSMDANIGPDIEFTYDGAGRRTSSSSTAYGYDTAGYLASATTATTAVSYTTDARGLRQSRTEGTTTDAFLWSTVGALPLLLDDGTHRYIYGPGLTPIAQVADDDTVRYFHTDLLGSVRLVTDGVGTAAASTTFDEFGSPTTHTGPQPAFGFTGAWTDSATGLVHLRARDYDPATGQFLTVDPIVDQTREPYAYVGNNPLLLTDPSGLASLSDDEVYDRPYILANMFFNASTGGLYGVQQSLCAGNDLWTSLNMAYNPVYSILEGTSNGVRDIQNGASGFDILMDGFQVAGGIAGIAGIRLGIAGSLGRVGPNPNPVGGGNFVSRMSESATIGSGRDRATLSMVRYSEKNPEDGLFDVIGHGSPNSIAGYSASDVGARIGQLSGGQDIRLLSCQTACPTGTFAQDLANVLGVRVKAPTTDIGASSRGNTLEFFDGGEWRWFLPQD